MTAPWSRLFTEQRPAAGATESELQAVVSALFQPVTEIEVLSAGTLPSNSIDHRGSASVVRKEFDSRNWWLPSRSLPDDYLDFLRWSNGGSFMNGERRFDPFIVAGNLRSHLIRYAVPIHMPGAIPFALDGSGCFYVFDMRRESSNNEYPILYVSSGSLGYNDAVPVASSFLEACKGATNPSYDWLD